MCNQKQLHSISEFENVPKDDLVTTRRFFWGWIHSEPFRIFWASQVFVSKKKIILNDHRLEDPKNSKLLWWKKYPSNSYLQIYYIYTVYYIYIYTYIHIHIIYLPDHHSETRVKHPPTKIHLAKCFANSMSPTMKLGHWFFFQRIWEDGPPYPKINKEMDPKGEGSKIINLQIS